MGLRVKGTDCQVRIMQNGAPLKNLTNLRSWTLEDQYDKTSEGYQGETTNRKDETYNGCALKLSFHEDDPQIDDLKQALKDRAQRRTPGLRIDAVLTKSYPSSGKKRRYSVTDLHTGNINTVSSGKNAFVTTDFDLEADDYTSRQVA